MPIKHSSTINATMKERTCFAFSVFPSYDAAGEQRDGYISKQEKLAGERVLFMKSDRSTQQCLPDQPLCALRSDVKDSAPLESRRASKVRMEEQGSWHVMCGDQEKACAGEVSKDKVGEKPRGMGFVNQEKSLGFFVAHSENL